MKAKPIPQYEFDWTNEAFNLIIEQTQDGARIALERERKEQDLEQAKKRQKSLPIFR